MSEGRRSPDFPPASCGNARSRRVSGTFTALWLVACLVLTAVLIPAVLRLPRWVEFEIVLGVWWLVWFAVLTWFLHAGLRVADDLTLHQPRNWFSSGQGRSEGASSGGWWDGFFWGSSCGGDAGLVLVLIVALLAGTWFLIEIAIPVVCFLLYLITRGMLAGVTNDRNRCRGSLGRAAARGLAWATVYTAPLAATVWFVHYMHQRG
jgi:hypothetical protein